MEGRNFAVWKSQRFLFVKNAHTCLHNFEGRKEGRKERRQVSDGGRKEVKKSGFRWKEGRKDGWMDGLV